MQAIRHLFTAFVLIALLVGTLSPSFAQGRIAVEKRVRLSSGKTKTIRGKANASTSYVYKLRADKDRRLEARISSEGGTATFSIVPPGTQIMENAAGIKEWAGVLPETGEYVVVVTMNTSGDTEVPYTLELTIR